MLDPIEAPSPLSSGRAVVLILAAITLAIAINLNDGSYSLPAVAWLVAGLIFMIAGALLPDDALALIRPGAVLPTIAVCLAVQFALNAQQAPGAYDQFHPRDPEGRAMTVFHDLELYWALIAISAVLAGTLLSRSPFTSRWAVNTLIFLFVLLAGWLVFVDYLPTIDVFYFQQRSITALLKGQNPYSVQFDVIYRSNYDWWYGPSMIRDDKTLFGYPYMPLTLIANLPGYFAGDIRFSGVLIVAFTALIIARLARTRIASLAAVAFLFMPRTLFVIDQSWNESLVLLLLATTVHCAIHRPRLVPYAFGLLIASKQYMPFALALTPLLVGRDWRKLLVTNIVACAAAAIVTIPFILPDSHAFFHSIVTVQMVTPFRDDALSIPALWEHLLPSHAAAPSILGFAGLALFAALALWRCKPSPTAFAIAIAVSYLVFFAFNRKAFLNYYFLIIGAIWCAVATLKPLEYGEQPAPA